MICYDISRYIMIYHDMSQYLYSYSVLWIAILLYSIDNHSDLSTAILFYRQPFCSIDSHSVLLIAILFYQQPFYSIDRNLPQVDLSPTYDQSFKNVLYFNFKKYNVQTSGGPPSYAGDAVQLIGVANLAALITISQYFAGWVLSERN